MWGEPQTHNVTYSFNRNLWAISALATEKLQYSVNRKPAILMLNLHFNWYFYQMHVKLIVGITIFPLQ